jgi:hypothetical protein
VFADLTIATGLFLISASFFAGFVALTGLKTFINPILYSNTCFHDITVGSNSIGVRGEYFAKPGFDNCTGLGSIDCSKFILNPYIFFQMSTITIIVGQIIRIPIQTNVTIEWSISNKNILINNGYLKGNTIGTAILKASANNLFATIRINIISKLRKMIFTK